MAIIPNKADGEILYAKDLFRIPDSNNESLVIASSTTETTLGSLVIPADSVTSGCLVLASLNGHHTAAAEARTATFNLKAGSPTDESTAKTITFVTGTSSDSAGDFGGAIVYWLTGQTWTDPVSILVTGTNSHNSPDAYCRVEGLTAIAL